MNEDQTSTHADSPQTKPPRRRIKRLLVGAAAIVVLLIVLALLAPTIAGSALGRSIVTSQINNRLNGSVKIDETSFGWFSGQKLGGIKLYDAQNSLIAEVDRVETGLTLASAVRGNLDLGPTLVDVNLTRLQVDRDGHTNFEQLVKQQRTPGVEHRDSSAAAALPDVRADITVRYRGTIEYLDRIGGTPVSPPLIIEPGQARVTITNINDPIDIAAAVALRLGQAAVGKIDVVGKLDAVDHNRLDLDKLQGSPKVTLHAIDLSAITPLLRIAKIDGEFGGIVNGNLALTADGLKNAAVDGDLQIADAMAKVPQLNGDVVKFATVSVPLKITRTVIDSSTTRLKIESLKVQTPTLQIVAAGDVTEQALQNLAHARPPGSDGWLNATIDASDLAALANQLRNTAHLQQDVQITGGRAVQQVEFTLQKDRSFAKIRLDADAQGTRGGKAVALKPISLAVDATYLSAASALQGVSDLAVVLTSSFATAKGGGKTLDQLDFGGDFDLGKLKGELEQFVDLGNVNLAGRGTYTVGTRSDLGKPDSDIAATAGATLTGIDVRLPDQPPIVIGNLNLAADATLRSGANGQSPRLTAAKLAVASGDSAQDKVLELVASASNIDLDTQSVQRFEISNLSVSNLPRLQQQFGAFVPALKDYQLSIRDGQAYSKIAGSYDGTTKTLKLESADLSTPNLTLARGDAVILNREKLIATAAGSVTLAQTTALDLSRLSVTSSFVNLSKSDVPLAARLDPSGAITGNGQLKIGADVAQISKIAQAFSASPSPAQITSGRFDGTIDLAGGVGKESTITLDGLVKALTVAAAGGGAMNNEQVEIKATATTSADLSSAKATANIDSSFARVNVEQADVKLNGAGVYDMLQLAQLDVAIPDLPKLYALANAFTPGPMGKDAVSGQEKPRSKNPSENASAASEPLTITSGGAAAKVGVWRSGQSLRVSIPDLRVSKLAIARGDRKYAFDPKSPISFTLDADLDAAGTQLRGVKVTRLDGDLRVARLEMPQPIAITFAGAKPQAAGTIKLTGNLRDSQDLLAIFSAIPEGTQLAGALNLTTVAETKDQLVTVRLAGTIDQFQLRRPEQKAFEQRQVKLDGLAKIDTKANVLSVDNLALKLPDNDTLGIDLSGGVVSLNDLLVRLDNARLQYSYDLEQLWPLALPFLDPETQQKLADTVVKGKLSRTIAFKGSYDAGKPFNQAIAGVSGDGAFDVEFLDSQGVTINSLSIPFVIDRGVVKITEAKPAQANNGTLNLAGLVIDLTQPVPRLSGPKKQRLLHNCSINPALGDSLGKYINPVFPNSERAKGILDVTIDQLDQVALGPELFTQDSGRARIVFSITDMDIANPLGSIMFGPIAGKLNPGWASGQADTFKGEIRDAVITLENGRTTQQVSIRLTDEVQVKDPVTGKPVTVPKDMMMAFDGDIRLSDLSQKLKVTVPADLVAKFINASSKDVNQWFPGGVPITLAGTTLKPKADLGNIVQRMIEGRLRSGLTGGKDDPLGDLLRGLTGDKSRDQEPEQRRRDDRKDDRRSPRGEPPRDDRPR